jgi:hypothetical protein
MARVINKTLEDVITEELADMILYPIDFIGTFPSTPIRINNELTLNVRL